MKPVEEVTIGSEEFSCWSFRSLLERTNLFLRVLKPAEEVKFGSSSAGSQALEEVDSPADMEPADHVAAETLKRLM